ncbi:MAG TPA: glycosyltransferase [Bacteroidia bacterium]|nr:glycosyltransferase [Bacteroidia bacterium]
MKILEVNTEKTWRGGERQTFYNMKGFRDAGNEVHLLCKRKYPLSKISKKNDFNTYEVKSTFQTILFLLFYGNEYDIIHAQTAKAQLAAVIAKPIHRRKVVYTRRVDFIPKGFFTKMKYRFTNQLIAISTPVKKILENFGMQNVLVISDAVENTTFDKHDAQHFILENNWNGKKIIGTIAALVPHKDPITMVNAVYELSLLRDDFVFLHFGEGILKKEVQNEINKYHLEKIFILNGFTENVESYFSVFDVYAMSSEEEGLGSSVLDAFIYKVPVASTNAGGLKEIVSGNGLLCEIKNAKMLAKNISELLDNQQLRNELTDKAFLYASENHSVSKITSEYIAVFEQLLAVK